MKKIIGLLLGVLMYYGTQSQVLISILFGDILNTGKIEFGLDGGFVSSNIHGLAQSDNIGGFNLGFYFDIKLKNPAWMLNTGVIVKSPLGAKGIPVYSLNDPDLDNSFEGGSVSTNLRYFSVPVMIKYQFKNRIYVKGGVQLGLMNKAFDEFTNSVKDDKDLSYELKTKDLYHPLDAGLAAGLGYRLMRGYGMNLGIQYYYGLVDILVDDSGPSQMNRALYINLGIPIGAGAAKKKAAEKSNQ